MYDPYVSGTGISRGEPGDVAFRNGSRRIAWIYDAVVVPVLGALLVLLAIDSCQLKDDVRLLEKRVRELETTGRP